jgi:hypothetical protein
MSDDLVKRLRKNVMCGDAVIEEAADHIEKLEAALREIAGPSPVYFDNGGISWLKLCALYRKIAKNTLEETDE